MIITGGNKAHGEANRLAGFIKITNGEGILCAGAGAIAKGRQETIATLARIEPLFNLRAGNR